MTTSVELFVENSLFMYSGELLDYLSSVFVFACMS